MRGLLSQIWIIFLWIGGGGSTVLKKRILEQFGEDTGTVLSASFPIRLFNDQGHAIGFPVVPFSPWFRSLDGKLFRAKDVQYRFTGFPRRHSDRYDELYPGREIDPNDERVYQEIEKLDRRNPIRSLVHDPGVFGLTINDQSARGLFIEKMPDSRDVTVEPVHRRPTFPENDSPTLTGSPPTNQMIKFLFSQRNLYALAPRLLKFLKHTRPSDSKAEKLHRELNLMGEEKVVKWLEFSVFLSAWKHYQSFEVKHLPLFDILESHGGEERYYLRDFGDFILDSLAPLLLKRFGVWDTSACEDLRTNFMNWGKKVRKSHRAISQVEKDPPGNYREGVFSWLLSHGFNIRIDTPWDDQRVEKLLQFMKWASSSPQETGVVQLGYFGVLMNHTQRGPEVVKLLRNRVAQEFGASYSMLELEPSLTISYIAGMYAADAWDYILMEQEAMIDLQKLLLGELSPTAQRLTPSTIQEIADMATSRAQRPSHAQTPQMIYKAPTFTKEDYHFEYPERWHPDFADTLGYLIEFSRNRAWTPSNNHLETSESSQNSNKRDFFSQAYKSDRYMRDSFRILRNRIARLVKSPQLVQELQKWPLRPDRLEALVAHCVDWTKERVYSRPISVHIFRQLEIVFIKNMALDGRLSPVDGLDAEGQVGIFGLMKEVVESLGFNTHHITSSKLSIT